MKHFCLFLLLSGQHFFTNAQDYIMKRNGNELKVLIKEINESEIIFNYFDSLNKPLYAIAREEVFYVKYANGNQIIITPEIVSPPKLITPGLIERNGMLYFINGQLITPKEIYDIIAKSGNKKPFEEMIFSKSSASKGQVFIIIGIPFASINFLLFTGGLLSLINPPEGSNDLVFKILTFGGLAGETLAVLSILKGNTYMKESKVHFEKAIRLYNESVKK